MYKRKGYERDPLEYLTALQPSYMYGCHTIQAILLRSEGTKHQSPVITALA